MLRFTIIALGLLVAVPWSWAQVPETSQFEVPGGGPLSLGPSFGIYQLMQDRTGFLWVASDHGLYRYDGHAWQGFAPNPDDSLSLPGSIVFRMAERPDGRFWLNVPPRVGVFDPHSGHFEEVGRMNDGFDEDIATGPGGSLWTSESGAGIRRYAEGQWRNIWQPTPDSARNRPGLLAHDGGVWGFSRTRLIRLAPSRRDELSCPSAACEREVLGGWVGPDRTLWLLTDRGLFRRPDTAATFAPIPANDVLRALLRTPGVPRRFELVDRDGVLWMSGQRNAILAFDTQSGASQRHDSALVDPALPSLSQFMPVMIQDRQGALWFGTGRGVRLIRPRNRAFRSIAVPGAGGVGVALAETPDSTLYAKGFVGPLARLDDDQFVLHAPENPVEGGDLTTNMRAGRSGMLWLTTWNARPGSRGGGLVRVDPRAGTMQRWASRERGAWLATRWSLEDEAGRLWLGAETGLYHIDTGTRTPLRHFDESTTGVLPSDHIWSLAEAEDARLWVGTYGGGLSLLDPNTGTATHYQHDPRDPRSLPANDVTVIHPSRAEPGVVWVGTYSAGIARLDTRTGTFHRFRAPIVGADPTASIMDLAEDHAGRIWVGTASGGLLRLQADARQPQGYRMDALTIADGLPEPNIGLYDMVLRRDGSIALGHYRHVTLFHPDSLAHTTSTASHPLVVTEARVSGALVAWHTDGPLRLAPDDESVAVEFASLDLVGASQTEYDYRLTGLDTTWTPAGPQRTASYANLPPGAYTLQVRTHAASVQPAAWLSLPIVVEAAWWERTDVRALGLLLLLALTVAGVRYAATRELRRRLRQAEIEGHVRAERDRISQDLHDHVGAQLSAILSGIDLARLTAERAARRGDSPAFGDVLGRLEHYATDTMTQLRETVWALHHDGVTVAAFHERITAYARERVALDPRGTQVRDTLGCSDEAARWRLLPSTTLHLYRIVQEAIENAIKHAEAQRLSITCHATATHLTIALHDDGTFKPHADGGHADGGLSGYGLGGMRKRAEDIGATFALRTEQGTEVRIQVPLAPIPAISPD